MKLRFLVALVIGYVLGARAGRSRYDEIIRSLRELADSDLVRQLRADLLGDTGAGDEARVVTPPVIVGPGPRGGSEFDTHLSVPDVEPSSASAGAPGPDAALQPAKRLDPPGL